MKLIRLIRLKTDWELDKDNREKGYRDCAFRIMFLATIFGGTLILTIDYFGWIS